MSPTYPSDLSEVIGDQHNYGSSLRVARATLCVLFPKEAADAHGYPSIIDDRRWSPKRPALRSAT